MSVFKHMTLKYIDLFCGLGSFHESFKQKGWECVLASDIDQTVHDVYEKNHGIKPVGDIYEVDPSTIPHYDILCAGFPCQAFSQAGRREGLNDKRGVLFLEIIRLVKVQKPKVLILENVPGLISHDNGNTFKVILDSIKDEGYTINYKIIKCSDFGIPQMRKRLFIVCIRDDIIHDVNIFDLKEYEQDISLKQYLNKNFEKKYAYTIRCGGAKSPITSKQNWDGYWVDGKEYRLTVDDAKKLQGFGEDFFLSPIKKDTWRHLGNTIPTIFTKMMSDKVESILRNDTRLNKMTNRGEDAERNIIKTLFSKRNDKECIFSWFGIRSCIELRNPINGEKIDCEDEIQKASSRSKADIIIDFVDVGKRIFPSIKSLDGNSPAILNHTPRHHVQWSELLDLNEGLVLDSIIQRMNETKTTEDVHILHLNLSNEEKLVIHKVIRYFVFEGTGCGVSVCPADSVLYTKNGSVHKFYNEKDIYITHIIDKLILSMRDKSMPPVTSDKYILCEPWVYYNEKSNKHKGSLHIRVLMNP